MPGESHGAFSLSDKAQTEADLLALASTMYPKLAPKVTNENFLRDGGFNAIQYFDFITAVEQNFRVTIPHALSFGIDSVSSLANVLHSGELKRWI